MSYVVAAYGVTFVVLVGYGWMVARERAELRRGEGAENDRDGRGAS